MGVSTRTCLGIVDILAETFLSPVSDSTQTCLSLMCILIPTQPAVLTKSSLLSVHSI